MNVRAAITVTRVDHLDPGTVDATTIVTLKGTGEEAIRVYWQLPPTATTWTLARWTRPRSSR